MTLTQNKNFNIPNNSAKMPLSERVNEDSGSDDPSTSALRKAP